MKTPRPHGVTMRGARLNRHPRPAVLFLPSNTNEGRTNMKSLMQRSLIVGMLVGGTVAMARPVTNISPQRHPNLAAAQQLSAQAWEKVEAAQVANEWDLGGHAKKAKELLDQVNAELKLAAETANAKGK
jgi:hypothetical protein